jgi:hypothetical protein
MGFDVVSQGADGLVASFLEFEAILLAEADAARVVIKCFFADSN